MNRLWLAFCILLSLVFIGCGGGAPGTGPGNNNGNGGNTGTSIREIQIETPNCLVPYQVDSRGIELYNQENPCEWEVYNRTGSENPIMEFKVWASDCSVNRANIVPIPGSERSWYKIKALGEVNSLMVPSRGQISIMARITVVGSAQQEHEWNGATDCRNSTTFEPNARVQLVLGRVR